MKLIQVLSVLLLTFISPFAIAKKLEQIDFIGTWKTQEGHVDGQLIINEDFSGVFIREMSRGNTDSVTDELIFTGQNVFFHDDLVIIEIRVDAVPEIVQRLVFSGWETSGTYRVYGMLYLYDGFGRPINGLIATFEKSKP